VAELSPAAEAGGESPHREPESSSARTMYEADLLARSVIHVVKGMMEAGGISQWEFARRLGVSEARVSRLLHDSENLQLSDPAALGRAAGSDSDWSRFHSRIGARRWRRKTRRRHGGSPRSGGWSRKRPRPRARRRSRQSGKGRRPAVGWRGRI
jgi:plasmid maintenance system antidote protein VapI